MASDILAKREAVLSSDIKPRPRRSIHASQIPECARQGVYEFTHWQEKKMWGWEVQALMNAGKVQEEAYKRELRALGYELVEDSASIGEDMFQKYGIHGYIDTKIAWKGKRIPVEMKAVNGNIFKRIDTIDDMRQYAYMRKYIRQGLVYLLGTNQEAMMFALTDSRGAWKFVPMALDLDEAESVLRMAERIKYAVEAKVTPDRIPYDNEVCGMCNFSHICCPDIKNDPSVKFIDDIKVKQDLDRIAEIKPLRDEYDRTWDALKEMFAATGMKTIAVDGWVVTAKTSKGKTRTTTRYVVEKYGERSEDIDG